MESVKLFRELEMSIKVFNPFRPIIETDASPHARTLRTSFKQKLKDAFFTIAGSKNIVAEFTTIENAPHYKPHIGFFDFVTLFIPLIIEALTIILWRKENYPVSITLGLIAIPLAIVRALIACILVFNPLSLLIIGTVHLISRIAGGAELKEKANQKKIVCRNSEKKEDNYVSAERRGFWSVCPERLTVDGDFSQLPQFVKEDNGRILGIEVFPDEPRHFNPDNVKGAFYLPLFSANPNNNEAIQSTLAYLKLNSELIVEGMEGYIAQNANSDSQTIQNNCNDCREVLNLVVNAKP